MSVVYSVRTLGVLLKDDGFVATEEEKISLVLWASLRDNHVYPCQRLNFFRLGLWGREIDERIRIIEAVSLIPYRNAGESRALNSRS